MNCTSAVVMPLPRGSGSAANDTILADVVGDVMPTDQQIAVGDF